MLCGVTATLGSNPSATATAARPQWGRAVLLCRRGVRGLLVTPLVFRASSDFRRCFTRLISGRRGACSPAVYCCVLLLVAPWVFRVPSGPAAVCAGGRRPARESSALRASLGASARCPARPRRRPPAPRPGPGVLYVAQLWLSIINFACNSPAACSNIEFASLELQRFLGLLKFGLTELHAKFVCLGPCRRLSNFARNSPATCLDIEVVSLELQRFRAISKSDRGKLCAKIVWGGLGVASRSLARP